MSETLFLTFVLLISFLMGSIPIGTRTPSFHGWIDLIRGVVAVGGSILILRFAGDVPVEVEFTWSQWIGNPGLTGWCAALGVCAGRAFPPWPGFSGSKAIFVGLGAFSLMIPIAVLGGVLTYGVVVWPKWYRSGKGEAALDPKATLTGLLMTVIIYMVLYPMGIETAIGAFLLLLILSRHESDMDRLLESSH